MAREVILAGFERLRLGQRVGLLREDLPAELIWAVFISLGYGWPLVRDKHAALMDQGQLDASFVEVALGLLMDGVRGPQG